MAGERSDRVVQLLESIDAGIKQLLAQKRQAEPKAVASDRDLDGQYGDPLAKFMPRDWTGPSFKGRRFSECPPDLLDLLASTFDYFGDQAEKTHKMTDRGKPVADFERANAARARGWAKRLRDGKCLPRHATTPTPVGSVADGWENDEWPEEARH